MMTFGLPPAAYRAHIKRLQAEQSPESLPTLTQNLERAAAAGVTLEAAPSWESMSQSERDAVSKRLIADGIARKAAEHTAAMAKLDAEKKRLTDILEQRKANRAKAARRATDPTGEAARDVGINAEAGVNWSPAMAEAVDREGGLPWSAEYRAAYKAHAKASKPTAPSASPPASSAPAIRTQVITGGTTRIPWPTTATR